MNVHLNAVASGSPTTKTVPAPAMPALKPWEIAEILLCRFKDGQTLDVEHASDQQFEAWCKHNHIPVNDNGVADWPFELRCKLINHCRYHGVWSALQFPIDFSLEREPERDTEELAAQQ